MNKTVFRIHENKRLAQDIFHMVLKGDTQGISCPGQFINIALEGFYLRRPFSICDWDEETLTLIYKVVGGGTRYMSDLLKGQALDVLSGLGNGYDTKAILGDTPLLVGGGVGIPPLYGLAKHLMADGVRPVVILGFKTKMEAFYIKEFEALGLQVITATQDGSLGIKGLVTDAIKTALPADPSYLFTCGPEGMLRGVYDATTCDGQYSFEERMACGFGACIGCSCQTKYGYKRICKEGPVLKREEILW